MTDNPVPAKAGIVERLRNKPMLLTYEAADEIERLRAENAELKRELRELEGRP